MVYKVQIQTDPGEALKEIKIDGKITGSSDSSSNFKDLFETYNLEGKRILGTKAVVVNLDNFVQALAEEYKMDSKTTAGIKSKYSPALKDLAENGYWTCFWDKTNQVHHRDIMRFCYEEIRKSAEAYRKDLNKTEAKTEQDLESTLAKIDALDKMDSDMDGALEQIYELKFPNAKPELTETAKKMLKYSQGYQLSSENADDIEDLWKSRIARIQMHSSITNDQKKYEIDCQAETIKSLEQFLKGLKNTEITANKIEIPEWLNVPYDKIRLESTLTHNTGKGYIGANKKQKPLRIEYQTA